MFLKYLGHSCFYLKGKDFSVVTDPFTGIGYEMERVSCDYALSSHAHFDHNYFAGVDAGQIITESRAPFTAIPCFHDECGGAKRGRVNAFYFNIDGLNVLHLGDLGEPFSAKNAAKFSLPVDILFVPVGGNYTVGAGDAVKYAQSIGARVTVPMHYKTQNSKLDIAGKEEFLSLCGDYKIVDNGLEITPNNIKELSHVTVLKFD